LQSRESKNTGSNLFIAAMSISGIALAANVGGSRDWVWEGLHTRESTAASPSSTAPVPLETPAEVTVATPIPEATPVDADPFDYAWYNDPDTGHEMMIIDGTYPAMSQFDTQWAWPAGEKSGRCGDLTYAMGLSRLLGKFINPVDVYNALEAAGGHDPATGSGIQADRALAAQLYGLQPHAFGTIEEAEQFARNVDPNVYVIIGQQKTAVGGEGFSPYSDHIVGLWWDQAYQAWRAVDPNEFLKPDNLKADEPELEDNLRFWASSQITDLYHIAGWTNPNGIPPAPWQ
jgi:hypothetical protein